MAGAGAESSKNNYQKKIKAMYPADLLRDFLLDNKNTMTLDLIARVFNGVYDEAEVRLLIERLNATMLTGFKPEE